MTRMLKPCPFCGGQPDQTSRMDEDLGTHNQVEWVGVRCNECDIGFEWPIQCEPGAVKQWNTRADGQPVEECHER